MLSCCLSTSNFYLSILVLMHCMRHLLVLFFLKGELAVKEEKWNGDSSRGSGEGLPRFHPPGSVAPLIKNQHMVKIKDEPDCKVTDVKNESCSPGSNAHDLSEDEELDTEEGNSFEKEASFPGLD